MLFSLIAEGNILQVDTSSQILRKTTVCEAIRPFDEELSHMHEAEVYVFSDSVLCMGNEAMHEPNLKFTRRWKDHLAYDKEPQ